jgi:hypothetical protein
MNNVHALLNNLSANLKLFEQTPLELVIHSDWQNQFKAAKPQLVIVGDNPGKKEKQDKIYFHPRGFAGKKARYFIKKFIKSNDKDYYDTESVLLMNKCPFYSNQTHQLLINQQTKIAIQNAVSATVEALKELKENFEVPILITGCSANGLNKIFFKTLAKIAGWKEKFYFGKHFSYGHFDKQWDCYGHVLDDEKRLKYISLETLAIIEKNFKLA